jgi:hemerythrin
MSNISWDAKFRTGIPILDTQNKHFLEKVNLLSECLYNEVNNDSSSRIFRDFLSYTQNHFKQEELFYEQYDLQELDEHRQQHFLFQENLISFSSEVINEGPDALKGLTEFIQDWVVFHILYVDKNITSSIQNSIHAHAVNRCCSIYSSMPSETVQYNSE